jgi:hypothetical protein
MFVFFKKKRIEKLLGGAKGYVASKYEAPAEAKFSREVNVRYSLCLKRDKQNESKSGAQFSLKDNYNAKSVSAFMQSMSVSAATPEIEGLEASIDMSFVDKMLDYINQKQLRDSTVYKAAQVDRRLFSKIVSDRTYKPSKDTCIAFVLALQLSLDEATDMLSRAGYTLSHSSKRDVIIEYFIREKVYNLNDINEILFRLEQKTLGR